MHDKMSAEKIEQTSTIEEERYDEVGRANLDRKVLLKMDVRILPILALLFLCSFIDRTNVGNAKILGLQTDIGITDNQYAIGLCVFYATYIARYASPHLCSWPCQKLTYAVNYRVTSYSRKYRQRFGCHF